MFNIKKPGFRYFRKAKTQLFDSIQSTVSLAATNFPTFPEGKTIDDLAKEAGEGENAVPDAFNAVADNSAIALTVTSKIDGRGTTGGTIILNEQDQDDLILGILERRGKKGIGKILERIGLELPEEGIDANVETKSKFCPAEDSRMPGEDEDDKDDCDCPACQLRKLLQNKGRGDRKGGIEVKVLQIGGRGGARDGGPNGGLDDLFEILGRALRR
jgi:hypothetical protein